MDGWQNIMLGLGVEGMDHRLSTRYVGRPEPTFSTLEQLYEDNWLAGRIVDAVPDHAVRRWVQATAQEDEADSEDPDEEAGDFGKDVLSWLDELEARERFREYLRLGRLYGGSVLLYGVDDGQEIDQPLIMERVRKVTHLTPLSRWDVAAVEWDRDPRSPMYGRPSKLMIVGENKPVHVSRCAIYHGVYASQRRLLERGGWGKSVLVRTDEAVRRYGTINDYVEALYKDVVQGVMTIPGLDQMVSTDEGNATIVARMRLMAYAANAFRAVMLKDGETYERRTASFSGISEPITQAMNELAGAAQMPLTVLFGQDPAGFSTDDKSGMRNFYDSIANEQRRVFRAPLETIIEMGMASKQLPSPDSWSLEFRPLEEPSDKEDADTDLVRAQTDEVLVRAQVIDESEARSRLRNDPKSTYVLMPESEYQAARAEDQMLLFGDPSTPPADPALDPTDPQDPALEPADPKEPTDPKPAPGLVEVIKQAVGGEISRQSAKAILMAAFGFDDPTAEGMLGPPDFEPKKAEVPPALAANAGLPPKPPGKPKLGEDEDDAPPGAK